MARWREGAFFSEELIETCERVGMPSAPSRTETGPLAETSHPSDCGSRYLPLPRVDGTTLTYARFLRDYALPKQPCIITGVGSGWTANEWTLDYLLAHEGVNLDQKVEVASGEVSSARNLRTTVGKALAKLAKLQSRDRKGKWDGRNPLYMSAWNYVRGGSHALQRDFEVPRFFERAPARLARSVVLGNAAVDMKWLYVGTRNTASPTHVDTNLSSAWLWVARGRKEWVCAHGSDHSVLTRGTGSLAYGYGDEDAGGARAALPDLFDPSGIDPNVPLYRGFQNEGEICFNPSMCVHAVRNVDHTIVSRKRAAQSIAAIMHPHPPSKVPCAAGPLAAAALYSASSKF